jgi:hypothetical protein
MCPACDRGACLFCWHEPFDRCETCLAEDPAGLAPPVPWEAPTGRSALRRIIDTFGLAFRPTPSAPSFARPELRPAIRFALLTVLPLTLLRGIIPYTHTLRFGGSFRVAPLGTPSGQEVALDLARAMGMSLLLVGACALALGLPYVQLVAAYGHRMARAAALRVLMYRGWLLALGGLDVADRGTGYGLVYGLAAWGFPADPGSTLVLGALLLDAVAPIVLLLFAMRATARFAAGTGPLASFVATILPFVLLYAVGGAVLTLMDPWMPKVSAEELSP